MKRREFLAGAVAGATALSLAWTMSRPAIGASTEPKLLSILRRNIEVNGKAASVFGLQQPDGSVGLRYRADEAFNLLLRNETAEPTIVHWHGLTPPWPSDGVADAPLPLMAANSDRAFDFPVGRPGTYWMHAHTLQEQALLAAPLIVANPADDGRDEQEVVILLHDFSFKAPEELLAGLATTTTDPMSVMDTDHSTMDMSSMDASSGGATMDLNDIEYDAYLANDRTLDDPEVIAVERGGRVRLRIINGATATAFTIDLGEIDGDLIAVDGQDIEPIRDRRFPISMGQRVDLRLELPNEARSFPILALREGSPHQTGIILRSTGAEVTKIATQAAEAGPVLDLLLEARLRTLAPMAERPADRTFEMTLNGDMTAYKWSLELDQPILADLGDRVEIKMTNMSMMAHPMHLHGHHFQLVAIDGQRFSGAVRDTVLVPPMRSVTIAADANNSGQWAFHCHHLYHMAAGMMSTFGYRA